MTTLLICNAQIVNEGVIREVDVFIRDGRIQRIAPDLSHLPSDEFIDATGKHLIPGMIDNHFVTANTSLEHLQQESRAALAGGITSIMLMPALSEPFTDAAQLQSFQAQAAGGLVLNTSFYLPVSNSNLKELSHLELPACCGALVNMSTPDDAYRIDSLDYLEQVLLTSPVLVNVHAEDAPTVLANEESYRQIYSDDIPFHLHHKIHSEAACLLAASHVLELASKNHCRVHLLNLSSAAEVDLLERERSDQKLISSDVCSHFLSFSDADYAAKGALLKYVPAIKTDVDRAALMQGLLDGNIDHISSGHMPWSWGDKQGMYFDVPPGLPQAQFVLPSILEHYQDQIFNLELIVEKTSHSVAENYGLVDRGYIREGYWADLVLIDLQDSFIARNEDVISEAGWTVFNGNEFRSSVVCSIVNGQVVWKKGQPIDAPAAGKLIEFYQKNLHLT